MNQEYEKIVPAWGEETLLKRLHSCRRMLGMHGLLTDAEMDKVIKRINNIAFHVPKAPKEKR